MNKKIVILFSLVAIITLTLSVIWNVPYIFSFIGFSALVFTGHLVTIDDEFPRGWSNPEGDVPFPWVELTIKGGYPNRFVCSCFLFFLTFGILVGKLLIEKLAIQTVSLCPTGV